jgi:hypothetical protein
MLLKHRRRLQVFAIMLLVLTLIIVGIDSRGLWVKAQLEQLEPNATLTILASTGGTTDPPAGISTILVDYIFETNITLTAHPDKGFIFLHWKISNATRTTTLQKNPTSIAIGYPYRDSFGYRVTVQAVFQSIAPKITLSSPQNLTYNESSITLVFSTDKAVNWTAYSLDGGQNVTITGNSTINGMTNGIHNVIVYANDSLGNVGASQTKIFTVAIPPRIIILSPTNQTYDKSNILLKFTIDKPVTWIGYSIDGQTNVTTVGNGTIANLTYGSHNMSLYASDSFGNLVSQTVNFTVEKPQTETFGSTFVVAVITIIVVVICLVAGLLLYRRHRKHLT